MPLVNYEGNSSEEEDNEIQSTTRRLHLPAPSHRPSNVIIDDDDDNDDEYPTEKNTQSSSSLLANLPKPQDISSSNTTINTTEFPESELEDIVRGDNKEYAKDIPQLPKPMKRKRDGPVKILIPTIEQVRFPSHLNLNVVFHFRILMMKINLKENNQLLNEYVFSLIRTSKIIVYF
jgi:hypothetical protein